MNKYKFIKQNKSVIIAIAGLFSFMALGLILQYAESKSNFVPMYEDQLIVCNFEQVCQEINIDEYMNRDSSDKLWNQFNNEIDTFTMEDLQYD